MPEVYADDQVTVEWVPDVGPYGNNSYIVRPRDEGAPATVIDIPTGFEVVAEALGGRAAERVVVTHSHMDHVGGWDAMLATIDVPVLFGADETDIDDSRAFERLDDGAEIAIGGVTMRVIHTPGHTPGSICLLLGSVLFSGDTLFPGGPGASRNNEATAGGDRVDHLAALLAAAGDDGAARPRPRHDHRRVDRRVRGVRRQGARPGPARRRALAGVLTVAPTRIDRRGRAATIAAPLDPPCSMIGSDSG